MRIDVDPRLGLYFGRLWAIIIFMSAFVGWLHETLRPYDYWWHEAVVLPFVIAIAAFAGLVIVAAVNLLWVIAITGRGRS
jgi:hypothetical protein